METQMANQQPACSAPDPTTAQAVAVYRTQRQVERARALLHQLRAEGHSSQVHDEVLTFLLTSFVAGE